MRNTRHLAQAAGAAIAISSLVAACGSGGAHKANPSPSTTPHSTTTTPGGTSKPTHPAPPPPVSNTAGSLAVQVVTEPTGGMKQVYGLVAGAKKSVVVGAWRLNDQHLQQLLAAAQHRGVQVQVLLDQSQGGKSANQSAYSYLSGHHVGVAWAPAGVTYQATYMEADGATAVVGTGSFDTSTYRQPNFWLFSDNSSNAAALVATFKADQKATSYKPGSQSGQGLIWRPGGMPVVLGMVSSANKEVDIETTQLSSPTLLVMMEHAAKTHTVKVLVPKTGITSANLAALKTAKVQVHFGGADQISGSVAIRDPGQKGAAMVVGSQDYATSNKTTRQLSMVTAEANALQPVIQQFNTAFNAAPTA